MCVCARIGVRVIFFRTGVVVVVVVCRVLEVGVRAKKKGKFRVLLSELGWLMKSGRFGAEETRWRK